jgi:DNA-binding CsgD family transcriptional regulator
MHSLSTRWIQLARAAGNTNELARALSYTGAIYEVTTGQLGAAEKRVQEASDLFLALGEQEVTSRTNVGRVVVAAWRGHEALTRKLAEEAMQGAIARGQGVELLATHLALAVLENGLGQYAAALAQAQEACRYDSIFVRTAALPELIEAAVRSGEHGLAVQAVALLEARVLPGGTNWGRGVLARSQALVAEKSETEELYRAAIKELEATRVAPQLARARLLYGEWLRRVRRRRDAREQLRIAHQAFISMGADAFANRAEIELLATGEHVHERTRAAADLLTPHELRIARLVAEGATNPQVAAQLYISPRTVEYHLHKIFRKLGLTSRSQLTGALEQLPGATEPT